MKEEGFFLRRNFIIYDMRFLGFSRSDLFRLATWATDTLAHYSDVNGWDPKPTLTELFCDVNGIRTDARLEYR
ncbi:hypothetical protein TNCV_4222191 [Trichonephila clavipes]|nr:hypothetical protein TNCV_4222191 [Trichonephila clavipes]